MRKGIFALSILSILISNSINAEYIIKIPLEQQILSFESAEVTGTIELLPSTINRGDSSNITWDFTYADSITIEDFGTFQNKNGSITVSPITSRSYNVYITNGDKSRNEVLNLTVIQPSQEINLIANPTRIGVGQSSMITWDVENAYGINITNINDNNLPLNGYKEVYPTSSTSYTLTATGYEGVADKQETINIEVVPNAIINSFETDKNKITTGDSVVFSWNVSNAESLALNLFGPLVQRTSGSQSILFNTAGSFEHTLEATSLSGIKDTRTRTIEVFNPATITSFTVNGSKIINTSRNADLNFDWITTNSSTIRLNGNIVSGNYQVLKSSSSIGSSIYTLQAINEAGSTVSDMVTVNTVEGWIAIEADYSTWINSGSIYNCTEWSPADSTVTINQNFTQTRSCSQNQTRTRQDREQEEYTKEIRNVREAVTESQVVTVTQSQAAKGTKETWVDASPTYTSWVNSGGIYGCSNWSPDPSTVTSGQTFTQTATDCEQDQTRTRQERQQESTTLVYRNIGSPITETITLTSQISTRTATGTKVVAPDCRFVKYTSNDSYIRVKDPDRGVNELRLYWNGVTLYDGKESDFKYSSLAQTYYYNPNNPLYKSSSLGVEDFEVCKRP